MATPTPTDPPSEPPRKKKGQTEPLTLRSDGEQPRRRPPEGSITPPRSARASAETIAIASRGSVATASSEAALGADEQNRTTDRVYYDAEGIPHERGSVRLAALPSDHPARRAAATVAPETIPEIRQPGRDITGLVLGDRYELMHPMARGGMGEIYVARHLTLETMVAVKVMLADVAMVDGYRKRFQREARAMSLLNHRNIVRVLDFGFHDGTPYIVMELLNGRPLSEWLFHLDGLPSLADVDEIMRDLFDAFEASHNIGIVHRDLKPDNVFLSIESDGQRLVKVLDFGLARIDGPASRGTTVTNVQSVSGTPEYMSPEQCRSLSVTPSADLYSMGCLLTEMLQGFPPFDGPSHVDIMTKQMFVAPPPLVRGDSNEPVPPLLEKLRRSLLAKNPLRRPKNVAELRERWDEALDSERSASRLPLRKKPLPMGERSARQQDWTNPEVAVPLDHEQSRVVGLLRFTQQSDGVNDNCAVGLAAGGMAVEPFDPTMSPSSVDVVVVDADECIDDACAWLSAAWPEVKDSRLARSVVCVRYVDALVLNRLIAAGAGDVVVYPVDVVTLARKVRRALRKASRQRARSSSPPASGPGS